MKIFKSRLSRSYLEILESYHLLYLIKHQIQFDKNRKYHKTPFSLYLLKFVNGLDITKIFG